MTKVTVSPLLQNNRHLRHLRAFLTKTIVTFASIRPLSQNNRHLREHGF